ncbi:MAG TPA: DUF6077 domain-containing protein [Myxococcota bacterium]|nr:DUF6077 domain-containing protein [Myxococcota bacterium]
MRGCEVGCALFAVWTICAHVAVASGTSLRALVALYAFALAAGGFGLRGIRRRGALAPASWPGSVEPPARGAGLEAALWAASALCALYALFAHRIDAGDAFAVNLAVAAVDRPELPLLAVDTLHGRGDLPIFLPEFRLHGLELGYAALAWITGAQPIAVFHLGGAALGAGALPLAHAALLRWIAPRNWLAVLFALLALLAAVGDGPRGYGNTALLASWQGEAIAVFVFVPLVYAFAIRFALAPTGRHWALLAAAQIAALGCSAAALWAAPLAAAVGMVSALPLRREAIRRASLGALASAYLPLAAAVLGAGGAPIAPLADALGDGAFRWAAIAAAALSWIACPPGIARRFAISAPLAGAVAAVSGHALAALPVPLLLASILAAPLAWAPLERRVPAWAASIALVLAFAIAVPARYGWSAQNQVVWHWPGLKVPAEAVRWARLVNERAPRQRVLASRAVSTWIPVFRDHAYPLIVRDYLSPDRAGEIAYGDRLAMTRYATGELATPEAPAIFARGLDLYGVRLVCLRLSAQLSAQRAALRERGFRRSLRGARYEIWERDL